MPGLFPGIHFSEKERIEMEQKRNAKGEGSFKINKDGTVTHRKSVGYKANGQRKILTVTAATTAFHPKSYQFHQPTYYLMQ